MTRERAIEVLKAWDLNWSDDFTANEFEQAFDMAISALSADLRENVPNKFIPVNVDCRGYTDTFRCSKCGCNITTSYVMQELDYNFCPWCGGKAE